MIELHFEKVAPESLAPIYIDSFAGDKVRHRAAQK